MIVIALAAAATAPLLPPALASDLRCVAVIGIARDPVLAKDGAYYTAIVGADIMDATGQSRETVRDMFLKEARRLNARAALPSGPQRDACVRQMRARIAIEKATP
jgi:hypothetical protein